MEERVEDIEGEPTNEPSSFFGLPRSLPQWGAFLWCTQQKTDENKKAVSWAEYIDSHIWFHGFYGFLDGISVVYSTIKISCDIMSKDSQEYHDNLNSVLSDRYFWLPLVFVATFIVVTASIIGSYASKKEKKSLSKFEALFKTWLPYVRDFLKGGKNGYKAIKTLVLVLVHEHLLDPKQVRDIALHFGLAFSILAVINRYFCRTMLDRQKQLVDDNKVLSKGYQENIKLQQSLQALKTQFFDLSLDAELIRLDNSYTPDDSTTRDELSNKYSLLNIDIELSNKELLGKVNALILINSSKRRQIQAQLDQINLAEVENKLALVHVESETFLTNRHFLLLFSKALGGFIDAPYLYLGVMSLVTLTMPMFIFTSSILSVFFVSCIAVRFHEGLLVLKKLKAEMVLSKLQCQVEKFHKAQTELLEFNMSNFKHVLLTDRFAAPYSKAEMLRQVNDYKLSPEVQKARAVKFTALKELFRSIEILADEHKEIMMPTRMSETLNGMQDGLSAFGALASSYFLFAMGFIIWGLTFPPAFVVIGAVFGLFSMVRSVYQRRCKLEDDLANRSKYYEPWKKHINSELLLHTEELLLSPLDCNTDGLTKGEFFFQNQCEIVRCFSSGPYKAQNLADFASSSLEEHFANLVSAFWMLIVLIETVVLTARAHGQSVKDMNKTEQRSSENNEPKNDENNFLIDTTLTPSPPPRPPKGISCLFFNKRVPEALELPAALPAVSIANP